MPDYLRIDAVEPELARLSPTERARVERAGITYPERGEDRHTWDTLREVMQALASLDPPIACRVLQRGTSHSFDIGTMTIKGRAVGFESMALSEKPGQPWAEKVPLAPDVEIELDIDADAVIDEVARAAAYDGDGDAEGTTVELPFDYKDVRGMTEVLALVAGHLKGGPVRFVTEVEEQFFSVTLDRRQGVTLVPLWLFHPDDALRRWVRQAFPMPAAGRTQAPPRRLARGAPEDRSSRLTSGSRRSRSAALSERLHPRVQREFQGFTITSSTDAPLDATLFAELAKAVRAPENQGPSFEELRKELYEAVAKYSTAAATDLLLERLGKENEDVRWALYQLLSKHSTEDACRAIARAWRSESPDLRRLLGQILWRQERTVELCVRELSTAWASDPAWAKETVRVLADECVKVPRAWLDGAPEEASRMLGSLVVDG